LIALKQGLSGALDRRLTDLVLHTHLVSDRLEAIGIIGDQHRGSHTLGNRLDPVLERFAIFRCQRINRSGETADRIDRDAQGSPLPFACDAGQIAS
jgi:hypothetical protein